MIVVDEARQFLLVTQPDHAHFSAELLSLWRTDDLPRNPRRDELLFATREHDNGWREADAAPYLDPEANRPLDFLTIPPRLRFEIWERGTSRYAQDRPYCALLITQHALGLHRQHRPESQGAKEALSQSWAEFLAALEERRSSLMDSLEMDENAVLADYRWIELTDLVSLVVCNRWQRPFSRHGFDGRLEGESLYLDPFPLAGATTFQIPCRRIPRRPYSGDADLGTALAVAPWERLAIRVEPS